MFKKSLQLTAFVSTVIMSVGVAAPISQGATVKHNANMRKGASTKYKVTGVLQEGEEVKILFSNKNISFLDFHFLKFILIVYYNFVTFQVFFRKYLQIIYN